jgi:hypothetical protein
MLPVQSARPFQRLFKDVQQFGNTLRTVQIQKSAGCAEHRRKPIHQTCRNPDLAFEQGGTRLRAYPDGGQAMVWDVAIGQVFENRNRR